MFSQAPLHTINNTSLPYFIVSDYYNDYFARLNEDVGGLHMRRIRIFASNENVKQMYSHMKYSDCSTRNFRYVEIAILTSSVFIVEYEKPVLSLSEREIVDVHEAYLCCKWKTTARGN